MVPVPASALLVVISAVVAFVAGVVLDPVLRRIPRVARGLPRGAFPPVVALATGTASAVAAGALALRIGPGAELVAVVVVVVIGTYLSVLDLRHRLLPNVVVVPAIVIGAALLLIAGVLDGRPGDGVRALLGGLALFALYLVLALVSPGGIGMGDVKFAALIGAVLASQGWRELLLGAAAGFALVAVIGGGLLLLRRVRRGTAVPFGPMMLAGAVLVLLIT